MSLVVARRKRTALHLSVAGLLVMVAAVSAVSARDPDGVWLRVAMVMLTVAAAMWLPWQALLPAALAFWLAPNLLRDQLDGVGLFSTNMLLELPAVIGLAAFAGLARQSLRGLENEAMLIGATSDDLAGIDHETGVYEERLLRPALEAELARSQRFSREFALVLVGVDELRQRFDYRLDEAWQSGLVQTAQLLRGTRTHIDRVYRFGPAGFALLLPESGEREVRGLVRRLRRTSRRASPPEGEPGGPLATHFGATFFPQAATSVDDLLRRAEIALRLAEKSASRMQLDGAEAPAAPPPELLRREDDDSAAEEPAAVAVAMAGDQDDAIIVAAAPAVESWQPVFVASVEPDVAPTNDDAVAAGAPLAFTPSDEPQFTLIESSAEDGLDTVEPRLTLVASHEPDDGAVAAREEAALPELVLVAAAEEAVEGASEVVGATPAFALVSTDDVSAYGPSWDAWDEAYATEAVEPVAVDLAVAEPEPAVDAPQLVVLAATDSATSEEPEIQDAVSDLLKRLDETLSLIRTMKSAS